jgi:hypothetical protein
MLRALEWRIRPTDKRRSRRSPHFPQLLIPNLSKIR